MTRFAQFIMGPAGSGKTTYCKALSEHNRISRADHRVIRLVNLDPGAEDVTLGGDSNSKIIYDIDIRDLITIDDVMESTINENDAQDNSDDDDLEVVMEENNAVETENETQKLEEPKNDSITSAVGGKINSSHKKTVRFSIPAEGGDPGDKFINHPKKLASKDDQSLSSNSCCPPKSTGSIASGNDVGNTEETTIGPNGALVYCMEYLARDNFLWLRQQMELAFVDGDYILFDCPGQIELFLHVPVLKKLVRYLVNHCDFRVCGVFLVDAVHFIADVHKYFSVALTSLAVMVNFEDVPFINVFSKMDLVRRKSQVFTKEQKDVINRDDGNDRKVAPRERLTTSDLESLEMDEEVDEEFKALDSLIDIEDGQQRLSRLLHTNSSSDDEEIVDDGCCFTPSFDDLTLPGIELYDALAVKQHHSGTTRPLPSKFDKLTRTLSSVIESYDLLKFHPLNLNSRSSIDSLLYHIDASLQYDDDREPNERVYHGAELEFEESSISAPNYKGDHNEYLSEHRYIYEDHPEQPPSSGQKGNNTGEEDIFYGID